MNFGTFLLMQSPSARSSQEIYARGVEIALAAETLGFGNVWLAEQQLEEALRRGWGDKDSMTFFRLQEERAGVELRTTKRGT